MFGKVQKFFYGSLTKERLIFLNDLLKKALDTDASMQVSYKGKNIYDVSLNYGIVGPINIQYIEKTINDIFEKAIIASSLESKDSPFYDIKMQCIPKNKHQYIVKIKNIPFEHLDGDLLQASISAYIQSQEKSRQESKEDGSFESSLCFRHLSQHGLTAKYARWAPKVKGGETGLILFRNTEEGEKKVFVKEMSQKESLNSLILSITKKCGVKSPKTKVKLAENTFYLFSHDLTRQEAHKTYIYRDIGDYFRDRSCFFDFEKFTLFTGRNKTGQFDHYFKIDKKGIARLLLLRLILGLADLNDDNLGIIISEFSGKCQAKIALIDLQLDSRITVDLSYQGTISDCVKKHLDAHRLTTEDHLLEFAKNITDDDYRMAFEKIKNSFLSAFENTPASDKEIVQHWQDNFEKVQQIINPSPSVELCKDSASPSTSPSPQ